MFAIIGGMDDRAFLWYVPQETNAPPPIELSGHTDTVTSVGFNFNGNLLLTGAYDGTVRVWQVWVITYRYFIRLI
jgi:WD40 repeat protein